MAAAMDLLEADGADAVTTRAIAERADVPVATVYQFFPNRDAILSEILLENLEQRDADGMAILSALTPGSLADVVHALFDFHYGHMRAHPQLVALHYNSLARGLVADQRLRRAEFADALHSALLAWRLLRPDTDPLVTTVTVEMGNRVLEVAYHAGSDRGRAVLAEGARALTAYLQTHATPVS